MVLFFTPFATIMGWILFVIFTPFTLGVTMWWFRTQERHTLRYYTAVGIAWMVIAVVLDYLFIVTLLQPTAYYSLHVFLYYALMFLIPVSVGVYLGRARP
jgi:hypothetical protein